MQCLIMKYNFEVPGWCRQSSWDYPGYKKFFSRVRHAARSFVGQRPTRLHYYWAAPFRARPVMISVFVCVEKRAPGGGKIRGSGTEKRCSHRWFHTIFLCTDPYTNNIFSTSPPLPQKPRGRCESRRLFALFEAFRSYRSHFTSFGIVWV